MIFCFFWCPRRFSVEMVEKGEIMRCTYKTIGGISPFPTIFVPKDRYRLKWWKRGEFHTSLIRP